MRVFSVFTVLALGLFACTGDDGGEDDTATDDDSDSEADSDASDASDVSDTSEDDSAPAEAGFVRFAFAALPAVTERTAFSATLNGVAIDAGLEAGVLSSQSGYFHPGRADGWLEMPVGTHTLEVSGTLTYPRCDDPPQCESVEMVTFQASYSLDFDLTASGYTTVVAELRYLQDRQNVFGSEVVIQAVDAAPVAGQAAMLFIRRPVSPGNDTELRLQAYQAGVSEGAATQLTLAAGVSGVLNLPPQPAVLSVYRDPVFSAPYYTYFDLPTVSSGELLLYWDAVGGVPGSATGPGVALVQRTDSGTGGGGPS